MLLISICLISLHHALALRIPDTIYITTQSPIDDESSSSGELRTDLIAPEPTSISQYFQEQPFYQPPNLQLNPFLFRGPLIFTEDLGRSLFQQDEKKNIEKNSQNHERSSYELYRPSPDEHPEFVDMLPPSEEQDEPNYYVVKPKKTKKYSEADKFEKKTAKKIKNTLKEKIAKSEEVPSEDYEDESESQISTKLVKQESAEAKDEGSVESAPASRLDFAMHGHKGPDSYKFGFDTGRGENRQFKIEEKDEHGDVYGQYGYRDDKGKFRIVKYTSKKDGGFKVL